MPDVSMEIPPDPDQPSDAIDGRGVFATTHWSLVLAAGTTQDGAPNHALETLCQLYWFPLYAYARRCGRSPEDAADLTQAFFSRLLEKGVLAFATRERGRFRSFLLTAMKHFMANEWDKTRAAKRGGGVERFSLDAGDAERQYALEPADTRNPAELYDRRWALAVMDEALRRLEAEQIEAGKSAAFQRLHGFLIGEKAEGGYAAAAADLGQTEAAVKMAVLRLRARCRNLLREEIARTVVDPRDIETEYRALLETLRG